MTFASSLALGWSAGAEGASATVRAARGSVAGLVEQHGPERAQAEFFIRDVFASAYAARLGMLMPTLLAQRHAGGGIAAACGLRRASGEPLFLERYLDAPVEAAIAARSVTPARRESIVEVGNLAIVPPFTAREFIASLTRHLLSGEAEWTVFTAVATLRNAFARLGVPFLRLGVARLEALPAAERIAWGTYYDTRPEVLAVRVRDAALALLGPQAA